MANKRKITTGIVASVTAVALLLGGTFAWQSINQTALNEASDVINPGGRLHDDFNGTNKDVYVENFADEPIFARIRLDEYFEIVMNKGVTGAEIVDSIAGEKDENGNIISWETHKFDGTDLTAPYWEWTTGGSTVYMPTFNMNKDSLVADINGTIQGKDGYVADEMPDDRYSDYKEYATGETKEGTEIYDADTNQNDEVGKDFERLENYVTDGNITTVQNVTHTATSTLGATLISMEQWMTTYGSAPGEYWVYDTDGWVYWAQPIAPRTATGLLLSGIELKGVMDDSWYYAINVVAQFITADDLGRNDGTGFYDTKNGTVPTDNALALLEKIGVEVNGEGGGETADPSEPEEPAITMTITGVDLAQLNPDDLSNIPTADPTDTLQVGSSRDFFYAQLRDADGQLLSNADYTLTWSVENTQTEYLGEHGTRADDSESAQIPGIVQFNLADSETADTVTLKVTATADGQEVASATHTITITQRDAYAELTLQQNGTELQKNADGDYVIHVTDADASLNIVAGGIYKRDDGEALTSTSTAYHGHSTATVTTYLDSSPDGTTHKGIHWGYVGDQKVLEVNYSTGSVTLNATQESYILLLQVEQQHVSSDSGFTSNYASGYVKLIVNPVAE